MAGTRTANGQRANGSNSNGGKSNKFKNAAGAAGAAAGGFVGAVGGSFVPPVSVTFNRTQNIGTGGGGGGGSKFVLPEPVFDSTDDIRAYCNHVRALMISCAIELAMAGKILEARLAQVPPLPGENTVQARMRAKKVAWKVKRAADGATAVAKNIVATYGAFTREYSDLISPRPQQGATTRPFKF